MCGVVRYLVGGCTDVDAFAILTPVVETIVPDSTAFDSVIVDLGTVNIILEANAFRPTREIECFKF